MFNYRLMNCPATAGSFIQDDSRRLVRSHRIGAGGIFKSLDLVLHVRIRQIINSIPFKRKRTFDQPGGGKVCDHQWLPVKLQHIVLQLGHRYSAPRPKQIGAAILVHEHTGIYSARTCEWLFLRLERTVRLVRHANSDSASDGKIEKIFSVFEDAVRRPRVKRGSVKLETF